MPSNISPTHAKRMAAVSQELSARYGSLPAAVRKLALRNLAVRSSDPYERALAQQAVDVSDAEDQLGAIAAEHARVEALVGVRALAGAPSPNLARQPDRLGRLQQLAEEHAAVASRIKTLTAPAPLALAAEEAARFYDAEEAAAARTAVMKAAQQEKAFGGSAAADAETIAILATAARARAGLPTTTSSNDDG
jgi:hypothetical protein